MEIELDSTDGRDFSERPLAPGEMPAGLERAAGIVSDLGLEVQTHGWKHNHNNSVWICKPDSSCGMELCSPVLDESRVGELCSVLDALAADSVLTAGPNCSLHVHVDVSPFIRDVPESSDALCSILAWWVKCEPFMLDSVPERRRNSRFCRCIGFTDLFDHEEKIVPCLIVGKLKDKYLSLNTHHLVGRKRSSIEFRILEGTKDSLLVSSWVAFISNFMERSISLGTPQDYTWLTEDQFVDFVASRRHMDWIASRIRKNSAENSLNFWRARSAAEGRFFGRTPSFIVGGGDK